jgi:acylphosphatase
MASRSSKECVMQPAPGDARLTARILGQVQGVGFRLFVRRRAQALGLQGYVRNEHEGSVEVVAEGPDSALEQLLHTLRRGPPGAQVRTVETRWGVATGEFVDFRVTH